MIVRNSVDLNSNCKLIEYALDSAELYWTIFLRFRVTLFLHWKTLVHCIALQIDMHLLTFHAKSTDFRIFVDVRSLPQMNRNKFSRKFNFDSEIANKSSLRRTHRSFTQNKFAFDKRENFPDISNPRHWKIACFALNNLRRVRPTENVLRADFRHR